MDDDLIRWKQDTLLWWLILLVGAHSCALGLVMLFAPQFVLATFGFPASTPIFYPSQSGIFLLILGVFYLRALRVRSFVWTIIVSKVLAIAFLFVHVAFLGAPSIIWAAAAGDAAMLAAVAVMLARHRKMESGPG
jgi:uncharacterized membrane protein HdeD (DUF308 family)